MRSSGRVTILLQSAFTIATVVPIDACTPQRRHALRSRAWAALRADAFREHYRADPDVRVLSKHAPSNHREFGPNELLYDVLVCRGGTTAAANNTTTLLAACCCSGEVYVALVPHPEAWDAGEMSARLWRPVQSEWRHLTLEGLSLG